MNSSESRNHFALLLVIGLLIPGLGWTQTFTRVATGPVVTDENNSFGACWGDYDNDGDLDLFVANMSSQYNRLYQNNGDGTFTRITTGNIVYDMSSSVGASWGDYNNDGALDLFVANNGVRSLLYLNNGDGSFTKITEGDIANEVGSSIAGAWGDYDHDGYLDLFVANQEDQNNFLYHNNGDGTFSMITEGDIVNDGGSSNSGSWADYDNDGDLDLFVADFGGNNFLYRNEGDGTFTPIAEGSIISDGGSSVGVAWGDYDNDGYSDLFVSNGLEENNFLYHNEGDGTFSKVISGDIVNDGDESRGCNWGDFDNDGDLDLFVANDEGSQDVLYTNQGNGTFLKVLTGVVVEDTADSEEGIWGDIDNDGDLDLFVTNSAGNNLLYLNDGNANNWVNIKCIGTVSNTSAIGAKVRIKAAINGVQTWQSREISGHSGRCGQNSMRAHFGLKDAAIIDSIIVEWPGGIVDIITDLSVNQFFTIREGTTNPFTLVTTGPVVNDGGRSWGCAWVDYDLDDDLDLIVTNAFDGNNFLYTNNGDGIFSKITEGPVVTEGGFSTGVSSGDYDNDGDPDLFISNSDENNFLYANTDGYSFVSVTADVVTTDGGMSRGAAWGDMDNDGDLDLFVANFNSSENNFLYTNNGDGTFLKTTEGPVVNDAGTSQGASWSDMDNDGDLDLFVANYGENNFLYMNNGNGTFTSVIEGPVVNDGGSSLCGSWGDIDNDLDLDLVVTNFAGEDNFLYINNGEGTFTKITDGPIVSDEGYSAGGSFGDYDNDGDLDLVITNDQDENNFLYINNGDGTFSKLITGNVVNESRSSNGAVWGDYDEDGDLDLFIANGYEENNLLYINNGNSNSWINMKLTGALSNMSAIGTKVYVKAVVNGGTPVWQVREISSQTSYLSQNSPRAHFGLGDATIIDSIVVEWPSGIVDIITDLSVNRFFTVQEGTTGPLTDIGAGLIGAAYGAVAWGDYDNDEDLDIFLKGQAPDYGTWNVKIYENVDGIFADAFAPLQDLRGGGSAAWGDFDNDGDLDLVYHGRDESNNWCTQLYRNDAGGFTEVEAGLVSYGIRSSWADYDNDGDLDLLINGLDENDWRRTHLYRNDGGIFTEVEAGLIDLSGKSSWADYDSDGDLDLLLTGWISVSADSVNPATRLYRNDGGTFTEIEAGMPNIGGKSDWADYDNDGDLDIVLSGWSETNPGNTLIYQNDGTSFTDLLAPIEGIWQGSAEWGDYDNDGDSDLLVAAGNIEGSPGHVAKIYQNTESNFIEIPTSLVPVIGSAADWGDYDDDGDLDILLTGQASGYINLARLYRNNSPVANTLPSPPSGLASEVDGNAVTLSWQPATDAETPSLGLTYNLRIGTTPGGNQIMSAHADSASGYRRIPALGNVQQNTQWRINNLPEGWGYWSVQAVDAAFAGSPWAPEKKFLSGLQITNSRIITGSGDVSFPGTNVAMYINFSSQPGADTIFVTQFQISPDGTLPENITPVVPSFWEIAHEGNGTFSADITFNLGLGILTTDDQNYPHKLKLLHRSGFEDDTWIEAFSGVVATERDVTFIDITSFSQYAIGRYEVDAEGPLVDEINTGATPSVHQDITVQARVTDAGGVQSVDLMYLKGGNSSYAAVAMDCTDVNIYSGTIPGTSVTPAGLACYIETRDSLDNNSLTDTLSIQVAFAEDTLSTDIPGGTFRSGFPKSKWRLFSAPGDLSATTASAIIQDDLNSAPSNTTWRIFRYTGYGAEAYVEATDIVPKVCYWLKQVIADSIQFSLPAGSSYDLTDFTITLQPRRWHFISSPYIFEVEVAADQDDLYGPFTYGPFGSEGQESWSLDEVQHTLRPWGGYIIYNNTDVVQTLDLAPARLGKALAKQGSDSREGWRIHIAVEGQKYFSGGNVIGRIPGALEGRDAHDHPTPPYLEGYISLAMERPEWGNSLPRFTSDVRSLEEPNGVWDMDIFTKGESGPITLTSRFEGEAAADFKIVLLDEITRQTYDLLDEGSSIIITDYREELPYHLKAVAGSGAWVAARVEEILAQLPREFMLSQNYPNPFNPLTKIRFTLPKPAEVRLKVYNILGQEVMTLVDEWRDLGEYEIVWSSRDRLGRPLPSGIYFARLATPEYTKSIKMLLLK